MRTIVVVGGLVLLLIGLVWALQGADVLMGSAMSGSSLWLGIGSVLVVIGAVVMALGLRGHAKKAAEPPATGSRTT